jgi:hypothetical protein
MGQHSTVMDELESIGAVGADMLQGVSRELAGPRPEPTKPAPQADIQPAKKTSDSMVPSSVTEAEDLLKVVRGTKPPTPVIPIQSPHQNPPGDEAVLYGQIVSVLNVLAQSMETLRDIFIQLQATRGGRNADVRSEK